MYRCRNMLDAFVSLQSWKYFVKVVGHVPQPSKSFSRRLFWHSFWQNPTLVTPKDTTSSRLMPARPGAMLCLRGRRRVLCTGMDTTLSFLKRTRLLVRELSTSVKVLQYDLKRADTTKSENRKFFFDTHAVVQLLEENGFSTQQAEVIVTALVRITNSNMDVIYKDMVTKVQQEIMLQRVMSQIAAVKKDMIILEKSEFSALLSENEKVKIELLQLKMQLADVMNKVRSDNLLDMNLEKSRIKEMKAEHERKLLEARTEMMEMNAEQDRHMTQTNMKIDTEVAGLKTMLESHKLDTIKYLAGSVFTCLTVVLGFYRIWM
ncbi:mitochondrial calcium uniporter regulator 1 [Megalops cyprinoides]|uniref:mitochondrial calcium uniporter regulator 1 n=1 Tax=Megalops cyprinoides TaxID=118141 RepID=UPI00186555C0|nr:mitochondrial calcium uniporter regulator 1 [Megalops cyprinoides]